jgi:hypothetical protein
MQMASCSMGAVLVSPYSYRSFKCLSVLRAGVFIQAQPSPVK